MCGVEGIEGGLSRTGVGGGGLGLFVPCGVCRVRTFRHCWMSHAGSRDCVGRSRSLSINQL